MASFRQLLEQLLSEYDRVVFENHSLKEDLKGTASVHIPQSSGCSETRCPPDAPILAMKNKLRPSSKLRFVSFNATASTSCAPSDIPSEPDTPINARKNELAIIPFESVSEKVSKVRDPGFLSAPAADEKPNLDVAGVPDSDQHHVMAQTSSKLSQTVPPSLDVVVKEVRQRSKEKRSWLRASSSLTVELESAEGDMVTQMYRIDTSARDIFWAKDSSWSINPDQSRFLEKWDVLTITSLFFVAVCTPVQISLLEPQLDLLHYISCIIDLIFLIDMILQFLLMYPVQRSGVGYSLERRQAYIVKHYLQTWFFVDLASIAPIDTISIVTHSEHLKQLKAVKVVRLLRLLKLTRVRRLWRRFESRSSIQYGKLSIVKFIVIILLITHWMANLWAFSLLLVDEHEGVPQWIDAFDERDANLEQKTKDTWWKKYITCFYFASYTMTTVGYGDVGPHNIIETFTVVVMLIVSGFSWAVVLGQVSDIVAHLSHEEQFFRSKMDELNHMMEDRHVDVQLRRRLRIFFLSNKTAQRRGRQRQLIAELSPGLQGEVVMEFNRKWLEKVSLLAKVLFWSESSENGDVFRAFVVDVSLKLHPSVHAQSEVFGTPHVLYICMLGLVSRKGRVHRTGAVWGADFMLVDSELLEPFESRALTYTELTTLDRSTFMELLKTHTENCPELRQKVRQFCCWLAFQRAFFVEAKSRLARTAGSSFRSSSRHTLVL